MEGSEMGIIEGKAQAGQGIVAMRAKLLEATAEAVAEGGVARLAKTRRTRISA